MLISSLPVRRLGIPGDHARLRFSSTNSAARHLLVEGEPAFELSFWCGTCPFLFRRKVGADKTFSVDVGSLEGLQRQDDVVDERVIDTFARLLPEGDYLPLLLDVQPELVAPHDDRDYFTREQPATWAPDSFWALPENPRSYYYRTFETAIADDEHLYEFVVPMVPPAWNSRDRVQHYADLIGKGTPPTAVALSTLDICQPAELESTDYYAHWGLSHFLLDGHHKMEAAARAGGRVRLLALVSLAGSLAAAEDVARLPQLLTRPLQRREHGPKFLA